MGDRSSIEWTDATWNIITGCTVKSAGCTNCYAMKLAGGRLRHETTRAGLTRETRGGPVWTGDVRFNDSMLDLPLRWKRPRKIFVCAHGDLFHESVPYEWIDRVFAVIALCPQHVFQVLTKRPERMRDYIVNHYSRHKIGLHAALLTGAKHPDGHGCDPVACNHPTPLKNLWLGVSAENQEAADERIWQLLAIPDTFAAVRWVSLEPLLGPINLRWTNYAHKATGESYRQYLERNGAVSAYEGLRRIDWVVVGGESGPKARAMHPHWVQLLRDQCAAAGVAFLFKQWGEWRAITQGGPEWYAELYRSRRAARDGESQDALDDAYGRVCTVPTLCLRIDGSHVAPDAPNAFLQGTSPMLAFRVGKREAGRQLDGVLHDAYPANTHVQHHATAGADHG